MLLFNRLGCALAAIIVSVSHGMLHIINTTASMGGENVTTTMRNIFTRVFNNTVDSTVENESTTIPSALNDTVTDIVNSAVNSTMENGSGSTTISSILNNTVTDIVNSTVSSAMESGNGSTTISSTFNNRTITVISSSTTGQSSGGEYALLQAFIMVIGVFLLMLSLLMCVRSVQRCRTDILRARARLNYLREHGGDPPDTVNNAAMELDIVRDVEVVTDELNLENRPCLCQHDHQEAPDDPVEQVRPVFRLQGIFPR
ncbi:hypothetical protein [Ehrlichia chaffeensis]|uniref:hypothetical protein n=1 Tax=Ehrlichia chaffeensis TaxID=945 RepID=UPI0005C68FEE|nr:hypothetical protein [Ehrlichia chaffeensis]